MLPPTRASRVCLNFSNVTRSPEAPSALSFSPSNVSDVRKAAGFTLLARKCNASLAVSLSPQLQLVVAMTSNPKETMKVNFLQASLECGKAKRKVKDGQSHQGKRETLGLKEWAEERRLRFEKDRQISCEAKWDGRGGGKRCSLALSSNFQLDPTRQDSIDAHRAVNSVRKNCLASERFNWTCRRITKNSGSGLNQWKRVGMGMGRFSLSSL